jgi:hypothetical protein
MSAHALKDATVYLTHPTTTRRPEFMMGYHGFLDRAPPGRSEGTRPTPTRPAPRPERDESTARAQ